MLVIRLQHVKTVEMNEVTDDLGLNEGKLIHT